MKFYTVDKTPVVLKKLILEEFQSLWPWHQALCHRSIADTLSSSRNDGICFSFEHWNWEKNQWLILCYDSQVFWKDGVQCSITEVDSWLLQNQRKYFFLCSLWSLFDFPHLFIMRLSLACQEICTFPQCLKGSAILLSPTTRFVWWFKTFEMFLIYNTLHH